MFFSLFLGPKRMKIDAFFHSLSVHRKVYVKTRKKKNGHQINETRMCQANTREHKPASEEKKCTSKKKCSAIFRCRSPPPRDLQLNTSFRVFFTFPHISSLCACVVAHFYFSLQLNTVLVYFEAFKANSMAFFVEPHEKSPSMRCVREKVEQSPKPKGIHWTDCLGLAFATYIMFACIILATYLNLNTSSNHQIWRLTFVNLLGSKVMTISSGNIIFLDHFHWICPILCNVIHLHVSIWLKNHSSLS